MLYTRCWSVMGAGGQFAHLQLWNAGPDVIKLKQMWVASNVALDFSILYFDEQLFHPITTLGAGSEFGIAGGGQLSSCGHLRGCVHSPVDGGILITGHVQLWDTKQFAFDGWDIPCGHGIGVRAGMPDVLLRTAFQWTEGGV